MFYKNITLKYLNTLKRKYIFTSFTIFLTFFFQNGVVFIFLRVKLNSE